MTFHKLLLRQLEKCQLKEDECPHNISQWRQFLERVNRTYFEMDQDLYLMERSQRIASEEMQDLYTLIEEAQKIIHIGSWSYNLKTKKVLLSNEAYTILNLEYSSEVSYEDILKVIYPKDKKDFEKLFLYFLKKNSEFEKEIRIKKDKDVRWISMIGRITYHKNEDEIIVNGTIRDITEEKMIELGLAFENSIAHLLMSSDSFEDAVPKLLAEICNKFHWPLGILWSFDEKKDDLMQMGFWASNNYILRKFNKIVAMNYSIKENSIFLLENKASNPLWFDIDKIPNYSPLKDNFGINDIFIFPVVGKENLFFFEFFSFGSEDKENLDKVAEQLLNRIIYILVQFFEKMQSQMREKKLNNELIVVARQAGMAEIASSVLHNVGNVLNSVNVTTLSLAEKMRTSRMANLEKAVQLLEDHKDNVDQFIKENAQGKHLLGYLNKLVNYWKEERQEMLDEITKLSINVEHIKNIIILQQTVNSASTAGGLLGFYNLDEILNESLMIYEDKLEKNKIKVISENFCSQPLFVDRTKIHQIFVNLIKNGIDSVISSSGREKILQFKIYEKDPNVIVEFSDNGVGILPENITKIFSYGFTTKKEGHGFGLHSSALAAQSMKGNLTAKSEGLDQGATFILELPKKTRDTNQNGETENEIK